MPEIFEMINNRSVDLINDIRANLGATGTNATGKTSQSLRFELKQEGTKYKMQLFGRPFFMTVQTGRGPTKPGAPQSDPTLFEGIKEWIEAKGIAANPWAVTKSIHEKGTRLWRQGGREDIVQPAVDAFINGLSQDLLDAEADNFVLKIKDGFSS
jgi:hypothetical protein